MVQKRSEEDCMQGGVGGGDCVVVNSDTMIAAREKRKVYQTVVIPALMYDYGGTDKKTGAGGIRVDFHQQKTIISMFGALIEEYF